MKPRRCHFRFALPLLLAVMAVMVLAGNARARAGQTISGWFVQTAAGFNGNLNCTYYVFFPNGHMFFGNPPAGTGKIDYASLYKAAPKNCGTYVLSGETLTLNRNDGSAPQAHTYTPDAGGLMDSSPFSPVWRFADGAKIEGKWGVDVAVVTSGISASSSKSFAFHRDGTFEGASHAGVDGRTTTGSEATDHKGTYTFKDSKLFIKFNDGSTKTYDVSGSNDKAAPYILGIDGVGYGPMR